MAYEKRNIFEFRGGATLPASVAVGPDQREVVENLTAHEVNKGLGGIVWKKLLRYYGTKALRSNIRHSNTAQHSYVRMESAILKCLRHDTILGFCGTLQVIPGWFGNVGRHYYADRKINSRVSNPNHQVTKRIDTPSETNYNSNIMNYNSESKNVSEVLSKELNVQKSYRFNDLKKKAAFTLAEVLITLGIIGIVAAMTIPTLSQKIGDMQNKAIWKKKFSEISQVYTAVKLDNYSLCVNNSGDYNVPAKCRYPDDGLYAVRTTMSPEFVNAMVKHFKVIDTCGFPQYGESAYCNNYLDKWNGLCGGAAAYSFYGSLISGTFKNLPTASTYCNNAQLNGLYTGWDLSKKAILLQDGSVIYFGGYAAPIIAVDVNGFQKGPNVVGRDMFAIMLNENWIRPIGADGTFNKNVNGETCGCGKEYGIEKAQGFLGSGDLLTGRQLSGACCSYKYLNEK